MLLHLGRMRRPEPGTLLVPSSVIGHKDILTDALLAAEKDGIPDMFSRPERVPFTRKDPPFHDQGTIFVLWMHRPELFAHLSLRWDITQCRSSYGLRLWGFVDKDGKRRNDDTSISEEEHIQTQVDDDRVNEQLIVPGIIHL